MPKVIFFDGRMKTLIVITLALSLFACSNSKVDTAETDTATNELITDSTSGYSDGGDGLEQLLHQKLNAGLNFYGIGQEPSWSLEMDMENRFAFKSQDGVEMNTPPVTGVQEGGALIYRMQVEMGEMIISLAQMECSDLMQGQKFPYQVKVSIKRGIDSSFREYLGCGIMLK
jgi:uncharacterized membrane protein